jgi:hypothetical protein
MVGKSWEWKAKKVGNGKLVKTGKASTMKTYFGKIKMWKK